MNKDVSTEEKIKTAARELFLQKGYKATLSRDIADKAEVNLALLNYYFRSKEKLYDLIMNESIQKMASKLMLIASDESNTLQEKIDTVVNDYIDLLLENPHLPLFVLSEIQANPKQLITKTGLNNIPIKDGIWKKQLDDQLQKSGLTGKVSFEDIIINMLALSIFPIMGKPMIQNIFSINDADYRAFIERRRILIPIWIKQMLGIAPPNLPDPLPLRDFPFKGKQAEGQSLEA